MHVSNTLILRSKCSGDEMLSPCSQMSTSSTLSICKQNNQRTEQGRSVSFLSIYLSVDCHDLKYL